MRPKRVHTTPGQSGSGCNDNEYVYHCGTEENLNPTVVKADTLLLNYPKVYLLLVLVGSRRKKEREHRN